MEDTTERGFGVAAIKLIKLVSKIKWKVMSPRANHPGIAGVGALG
jgi:hypothetical protein